MSVLIYAAPLLIFTYGVARVTLSVNRKRAMGRSAELVQSGSAKFPCRVSWGSGTGVNGFVYGKITVGAGGDLVFSRRGHIVATLPQSQWIHREKSGLTGLVFLQYNVPGEGQVRIMLSQTDAETIEILLDPSGRR